MSEELTAHVAESRLAGFCNGCTERTSGWETSGSTQVCLIQVRSMQVRLCPSCVKQLQGLFTGLKWRKTPLKIEELQ